MPKDPSPEIKRVIKSHLEKLRKVRCAFAKLQHTNPNYYCVSLCIDENCKIKLNGDEEICRPMCLRCLTMKHRGHTQISLSKLGEIVHTKCKEEQDDFETKRRIIMKQYQELEMAIIAQLETLKKKIENSFSFKTTYTVLRDQYEAAMKQIAENPQNLSALHQLGVEVAKKLVYLEPKDLIEPVDSSALPEDEFIIKDYKTVDEQNPISKIDEIMLKMKEKTMDICLAIAENYNSLQDYIDAQKNTPEYIQQLVQVDLAGIQKPKDNPELIAQLTQSKAYFEKVKNDLENEKKKLFPPDAENQLNLELKTCLEYSYRSFNQELTQTIELIDFALKK